MPIIFFATLFSASLSFAFLWGLIALQNYRISCSTVCFSRTNRQIGSQNSTPTLGGLAFIFSQALTLYQFGWGETFSQTYLLGLGTFGVIGLFCDLKGDYCPTTYLHNLAIFLGYVSLVWYSPVLQSSHTWIPFLGMRDISVWGVIGLNGSMVMGTLFAITRVNRLEGLTVSIMLPLWSLLFIFFSHTAFGALWGWPYDNLSLVAAINLGSLAAFAALNGHPALILMGQCGALALGGGIAILFCALKCPLIIIGLLLLPTIEGLASLARWASMRFFSRKNALPLSLIQCLENKGYHVNTITFICCAYNSVIAAGILKVIHLLWL